MTAPAGIRVKKVKIPAFPFRNRAESIVYEHLTEQERAWLHWKKDVEDTWHGLPSQEQDGSNSVNAQLETATELNSLYFGASSSERLQEKKSHYKDDQFAEGLDAEWLEYIGPAETDADRIEMTSENMAAVLYFHGGGYYTGSKEEHRVLIGPLVRRLGKHVRILTINYRLAPQHPFPAALVDALSCYMWLLDQSISEAFGLKTPIPTQQRPTDNFQPHQVIFMGDSAGGGLALSLSLLLRDHASPAIPQPNKIVTWSPWLDLTQALPSFKENAMTDCIPYEDFTHLHSDAVDSMFRHIELPEKSQNYQEQEEQKGTNIRQRAQVYCPDTCLTMKYVSPLYETDFRGIPDVLIVCGSAERFANECILMASRLEEQQQPCRIDIHEDMPHIFPLFRFHPSSITALDRTSAFIREAVSASIYTLNSECNSSGDGRNRSDSVVIPISSPPSSISSNSSSSSSSPSRSPTPRLAMGKDLNRDRNSVVLFDGIEEGVYSQDENGALRMQDSPLGLKRTGSSSSLSSEMSSSTTGTQQQQQQQQTQRRRRSGQPVVFDPQTYSTDFASYEGDRKASKKTAVNVIDLSGSSVMSFHKRTRFGTPSDRDRALKAETEEATGLLDDGLSAGRSGIRKRRRRERLTLRDIVSDATLYEWEVLLKQGYIPTRHWPQPPTGGVSGRHGSGRRRMFIS
ncbi:hypothetical protein FBU30_009007 [Linnemannia zychae]|nr:hypothetical protein FBU30_009007 [Linnemannia zychae]